MSNDLTSNSQPCLNTAISIAMSQLGHVWTTPALQGDISVQPDRISTCSGDSQARFQIDDAEGFHQRQKHCRKRERIDVAEKMAGAYGRDGQALVTWSNILDRCLDSANFPSASTS